MADQINSRITAARAFVRSLNILLKFARMYDFGHPRTVKQYDTAWTELRTALGTEDQAGLLLAVSGEQLLLDGTPLESAAAEKSFARMLSSSGIASIHFSPKATQASLAKFVRAFPTSSGSRAAQLTEQLKAALHGDPHIHVNEVCFVPADSAVAKTTVAAQLAAHTLGMNSEETDQLLNDPEKLLQLIVAAEGTRGRAGGGPGGPGGGGYGPGGGSESGGGGGTGGGSGHGNGLGIRGASGGYAAGGPGASEGVNAPAASEASSGCYSGSPRGGSVFEGPASQVQAGSGSGTWNIVGEKQDGSGTPIDANAGGFWLSKGDSPETAPSGSGSGAGGSGAPSAGFSGPAASIGGGAGHPGTGGAGKEIWRNLAVGGIDSDRPVSRWALASSGIRSSRSARAVAPGSMTVETGLMTLQQDELQGILQVLAQIARTSEGSKERLDPASFQSRLSTLPRRARFTVSQALSALAAQAPSESSDKPTLLKLAEHIAVRFALESYDRGEVRVDAVRHMLNDMSTELDGLRKIMGVYEERMERAGLQVQSHIEVLAQEFWSQVPEEKKKSVLESADAWCVPAMKTREYVEGLLSRGETAAAEAILRNYASCIRSKKLEARRQAAMGLAELAGLYAKSDEKLFVETIREVGVQLAEEQDSVLRSLVGAAFVRLSQEATNKRSYPAMQRSVELLEYVETERPGSAKSLRPRIAVENRLPEFIEEALRTGEVPSGLKDFLRRMPKPASEQIAGRFSRVGFREDCDLLLSIMDVLGPEGLNHLRAQLQHGSPSEAIDTIGILARMDLEALERTLPERMKEWKRSSHDRVVRQIAASGAPERGRLLLDLFDLLDGLIRPLAVDEIGMSGEQSADMRLLRIAEGDLPKGSTDYLRLKAIEALGRLRTVAAEAILRRVAEARKAWRWANPSELRIVAAQALEKIDSDWVRGFIPKSGLSVAEFSIDTLDNDPSSSAIRQRRYPRLRLDHPLPATTTNLKETFQVEIPELALGGGIALSEQSLHPGSVVELRMNAGQKGVKVQTIVRDANTQARAFEVVEMDLEERAKLRKLLVQLGNIQKRSSSQERSRHGMRTLLIGGNS
jgi:hypothetical protein